MALQHFGPTEIVITKEQASRILRYFFPSDPVPPNELSDEDVSYAQALLIEAVDASTEMGYVEILYNKAFMKVPTDFSIIEDIAKAVARRAARNWFRHATGQELSDPEIYETVHNAIAWKQVSTWRIRMQTGELTY